ncbi:tRNA (adenosine(37)-N6)-threonylcarbamoyltransferase complex ATPase subunit type 1 TsaE [Staphylococcus pettenkoferi]|uniref:tRNA (adenosine(37)-N6)-threonylcarbamoyltransferase complex ATPase subunit type 1 TsaE n=1 Tax=Staphylococcus pettenkoferi TaxID=170573 RepID=UPI00066DCB9C|nr:tRNA (adenosine(37)-N6)-threonylcarbamoyltransferase complex ATPase subunit type 1 TsaE [Staphylococcus pettenkoferi]MCI2804315.1 tRNA (adenosine(37)-N6)-threonylcarbamoyltransferase complex ATPase subunit type 1 TsaE [Staphylococcus pettenkoferi]MCY1574720.1 tRNA (adenosine(37)-N6)-threonylcarbamoyltransferase complex ATPase subunit type 1 TsaE [Staphylococcus pettenkoferi]MCY1578250.1 tRNA (adenosine(37)-N6)-threonylcarbamoyltransferase complex ATPase subunit type 1 TsaE [Staphylococcus pet
MIKINNLQDLAHFAKTLTARLQAGDLILLNGDLGAGKTTLSQLIGKQLGVKRNINSPTFNIIKSYKGTTLKFHHMDCYRLEDSEEDLGFEEYFEDHAVTVIEWSEFIQDLLPAEHLTINLAVTGEETRELTLKASGDRYQKMKEALEDELLTD